MKKGNGIALLALAAVAAFAVGARAQRGQQQMPSGQSSGAAMTTMSGGMHSGMTGQGMNGGMMGQRMMSQHSMGRQMMARYQEMSTLMGRLMDNFTSVENSKPPASMANWIADQHGLLQKMHDAMMQEGMMMSRFIQNCPLMRSDSPMPTQH